MKRLLITFFYIGSTYSHNRYSLHISRGGGDTVEPTGIRTNVRHNKTLGPLLEDAAILEDENNLENNEDEYDYDSVINIKELDQDALVIREKATKYRQSGKLSHDLGDYAKAAILFENAAKLLEHIILDKNENDDDSMTEDAIIMDMNEFVRELAEEAATCRLHQALCDWKRGSDAEVAKCVQTCSIVLNDSQTLVMDDYDEKSALLDTHTQTIYSQHTLSAPLLARAHLRRAKGRLSLGFQDKALEDARAAAFLGDKTAVILYGRLMRLNSSSSSSSSSLFEDDPSWPFSSLGSSNDGNSDMNPFMSNIESPTSAFSDGLFSSLLSSSSSNANPFANILLNGLGNNPDEDSSSDQPNKSSGVDGLAKSMLNSLVKKIDSEETQEKICNFLNSANEEQISQYAAVAGIPLSQDYASKLASFTTAITQQKLKRGVSLTKRAIKVINVLRKISKVMLKNRHLIVYYFLFAWIRSAICRPYPTKTIK